MTFSGAVKAIDEVRSRLDAAKCFNRKLKVEVAYHSESMQQIAGKYRQALASQLGSSTSRQMVKLYSSVKPGIAMEADDEYWVQNLLNPVHFSDALKEMVLEPSESFRPNLLLEIGPHSALAGPVKQILVNLAIDSLPRYVNTLQRGKNDVDSLFSSACDLFSEGVKHDLGKINFPFGGEHIKVLTDLPIYPWKCDGVYWHEGRLSPNYLYRESPVHDLLGCLSIDPSVKHMKWTNQLRAASIPWMRDYRVLDEVLLPAAGYMCMAIEAARQKARMRNINIKGICLRDASFTNALALHDDEDGVEVSFILESMRYSSVRVSKSWDAFRVISYTERRKAVEHCHGTVTVFHDTEIWHSREDQKVLSMGQKDDIKDQKSWDNYTETVRSLNAHFGPLFRLQENVYRKSDMLVNTVRIPDTAAVMPTKEESDSVVRVPVLDDFVQTPIYGIENLDKLMSRKYDVHVILTYVREVSISLNIPDTTGTRLWSLARTKAFGQRTHTGDVLVTVPDDDGGVSPVAELRDLRLNVVETESSTQERDTDDLMLCWSPQWKPDADCLTQDLAASLW